MLGFDGLLPCPDERRRGVHSLQRPAKTAQYRHCEKLAGRVAKVPHNRAGRSSRAIRLIRPPWLGANNSGDDRMAPTVDRSRTWLFGVIERNGASTTGGGVADEMIKGDSDYTTGMSNAGSRSVESMCP